MTGSKEVFRTDAEKRLAEALHGKRLPFKHNQEVAGYEVDFWFPDYKLVIEVDGYTHLSARQQELDRYKDQILMNKGIVVMRMSNQQIRDHINDCLSRIELIIQRIKDYRSKESINVHWKKTLQQCKVNKPTPLKKCKTIEEYFLSMDDKPE